MKAGLTDTKAKILSWKGWTAIAIGIVLMLVVALFVSSPMHVIPVVADAVSMRKLGSKTTSVIFDNASESVFHSMPQCSDLVGITFRNYSQLSAASILIVMQRSHVRQIMFKNCTFDLDAEMPSLMANEIARTQLRDIFFDNCPILSIAGIEAILRVSPTIQMSVNECPGVDIEALKRAAYEYPDSYIFGISPVRSE